MTSSQSRTLDTSVEPPPWKFMVGVAKRVAPTMPERWDDMAQVGYQAWVHCARKYDPSHGVPARLFLLPIVKHEMRRWNRREIAHSMGDTPYRVMRGEAVEHRTNVQTDENPEGINSLSRRCPYARATGHRVPCKAQGKGRHVEGSRRTGCALPPVAQYVLPKLPAD